MIAHKFKVLGVPAPQGSKSAVVRGGRAQLIEGGSTTGREKHRAWRGAVAWKAREAAGPDAPIDEPIIVDVTFRLSMPKSRKAAERRAGFAAHAVKPDIDKLLRSTFDGLVDGGLIADDSRIWCVSASAYEVTDWTGAVMEVRTS